jgi:hypothetical protein
MYVTCVFHGMYESSPADEPRIATQRDPVAVFFDKHGDFVHTFLGATEAVQFKASAQLR